MLLVVVSDSLRPHRLLPARLLCPWDFPGKNTGGIAIPSPEDRPKPEPGLNPVKPGSPALQADSLPSELHVGPSLL